MRLIKITIFLLPFLLVGCISQPTSQVTSAVQSVTAPPTAAFSTTAPPTVAQATAQTGQPIKVSNGSFSLTIISPSDQAILSTAIAELHGQLSAEAVLTINQNTYLLPQGDFTESIPLEEGLNSIQIVASDMDGNEVDLVLTLTYQP